MTGARFGEAAREMIYGEPIDAQANLVEVRRISNGRKIELVYDADVTGGDPILFRVWDSQGNKSVRVVSTAGNIVTLDMAHRLNGAAFISYGYSRTPGALWIDDLRGVPVPAFKDVSVP